MNFLDSCFGILLTSLCVLYYIVGNGNAAFFKKKKKKKKKASTIMSYCVMWCDKFVGSLNSMSSIVCILYSGRGSIGIDNVIVLGALEWLCLEMANCVVIIFLLLFYIWGCRFVSDKNTCRLDTQLCQSAHFYSTNGMITGGNET